jgi:hypothetical protein
LEIETGGPPAPRRSAGCPYESLTGPSGSIKGIGRLWWIAVSFGADGKPDGKWKRDER